MTGVENPDEYSTLRSTVNGRSIIQTGTIRYNTGHVYGE